MFSMMRAPSVRKYLLAPAWGTKATRNFNLQSIPATYLQPSNLHLLELSRFWQVPEALPHICKLLYFHMLMLDGGGGCCSTGGPSSQSTNDYGASCSRPTYVMDVCSQESNPSSDSSLALFPVPTQLCGFYYSQARHCGPF